MRGICFEPWMSEGLSEGHAIVRIFFQKMLDEVDG